jgi:hypothetical protein
MMIYISADHDKESGKGNEPYISFRREVGSGGGGMVSVIPFFAPVSWKEWLAFPVSLFLVLSREFRSGASYFVRVLDIEIPTIPRNEL